MRLLTLAVLSIALTSCNGEVGNVEGDSLATRESSLGGIGPTEFSRLPRGTRLVPTNAKSAHVIYFQDPTSTSRFVAWGFDLRDNNKTLFFIGGSIKNDLTPAIELFEGNISEPVQFDPAFSHGVLGQLIKPPKARTRASRGRRGPRSRSVSWRRSKRSACSSSDQSQVALSAAKFSLNAPTHRAFDAFVP